MEFEFKPLVGALPITFDMTSAKVAKILGPADSQLDKGDRIQQFWSPTKHRGFPLKISYGADKRVADIQFEKGAILKYRGVDLLSRSDLIDFLEEDEKAMEMMGIVVFPKLGISMSSPRERKNITVSRGGMWDEFLEELTELKRPKKKNKKK